MQTEVKATDGVPLGDLLGSRGVILDEDAIASCWLLVRIGGRWGWVVYCFWIFGGDFEVFDV